MLLILSLIKNTELSFGKKITIQAVDFIQKYLEGEYPNTPLVKDLFPADISSDSRKGCAPIIFGSAYIPLENIYSDDNYYLLRRKSDWQSDCVNQRLLVHLLCEASLYQFHQF